ncbi:hypothetical protein [Coleofasciculus sp. FACHB-SPT9]|uniref:hypothetical protein n=1 Tax=Cyanophyceae TaxID=3028117 RepID=UPI001682F914|nr:hypothetical protein [Coleofasciculus sp. FACHB-SPT9]MBD1892867.1 hypothetical protein [Coleofasciculus sp. FACHB-SPT9]
MTTVTTEEIQKFRSELADDLEALEGLSVIEKCEGDLEDAAVVLARRAKIEIVRAPNWLNEFADKLRPVICKEECKKDLLDGSFNFAIGYLTAVSQIDKALAVLVVMYVTKKKVYEFCKNF